MENENTQNSNISIDGYFEPLFIAKRERFDEEIYMSIVKNEDFNSIDRIHLKKYFKERRESGSVSSVNYVFGKGCEDERLGRIYPELGIGTMRFDIRNPLTQKFYWDLDFENCHYYLALHICKEKGLPYDKIQDYIENRNEWLKKAHPDRWVAKTAFLKTAYGGDVKLYKEDYPEINDNGIPISDEVNLFLVKLLEQFTRIANTLWSDYPNLHKLKTGKDKIPIEKKRNPKFSLMSLIFQTEERKHLLFLDWYLQKKGRYMGVLIHDGGLVEKLPDETEFPQELIKECEKAVNKKFGTNMKLSIKPIKHSYEFKQITQISQYQLFKLEFEKNHFLLQGKLVQIINDKLYYLSHHEAHTKYKPLNWLEDDDNNPNKKIKKYFLNEWFEDPERRGYENVDFIPNIEKCPETTYNLFTGFEAEKYKPETPLSEEDIMKNIDPIICHLNLLTKGHANWICIWLGNIFQQPDMKSGVAPLIRDQSALFEQCGGTGKNIFFEMIGYDLIGEKYFIVVGDNKTLYGDFNSQFEGKLLVMIEEASSKDNHSNLGMLNSKITNKKLNVNKKGVVQYDVKDYARYVFTTNNKNAIPIGNGNRRIAVFDTDNQKRGNTEYFEKLINHLNNPIVKWSFYFYLRYMIEIYKTPIQYQNSIPLTNAYIEMKKLNAPIYIKWILSMVYNGKLENNNVRTLYLLFRNWVKESKEGREDNMITETAFGLLLNSSKDANDEYDISCVGTKKKSCGIMIFKWNIEGIVNALKKLNLIEDDFVYESKIENIQNEENEKQKITNTKSYTDHL